METSDFLVDHNVLGLEQSSLDWNKEGEPCSATFGDIYFPGKKGLEAAQHIFLHPNNLPDAWQNLQSFHIGEVGFGTGLNFFATADLWKKHSHPHSILHFLSCEALPLPPEDIEQALALWPELNWIVQPFLKQYPPPVKGFHRLSFPESRIYLTLLQGDAKRCLSKLRAKVHAWYLDGFAPSKNSEMWSSELFQLIAELSLPGTTISTFSSAGAVRRALSEVGFEVEKFEGFEQKRESLRGVFLKKSSSEIISRPKTAIVIGGGLAGTAIAHQLSQRGIHVHLLERESSIASKASGNKSGVLLPYFTSTPNLMSRFYLCSFLYALRHMNALREKNLVKSYKQCGVVHFLSSERLQKLYKVFERLQLPSSLGLQSTISKHLGEMVGTTESECLFYELGGYLHPPELCESNIFASPHEIQTSLFQEALSLEKGTSSWKISCSNGEAYQSDVVVIANAHEAKRFEFTEWLPVSPVRGQLSELRASSNSKDLKPVLCYDGYFIPEHRGSHTIGSTFSHHDPDETIRDEENVQMLANLSELNIGLDFYTEDILSSRVAFRTSTYDRMPFVGAVPDLDVTRDELEGCPDMPGLFLCTGLGSRGLISSQLSAEVVASDISGEPSPLELDLHSALSPRRYLMKCLKKKQYELLGV